MLTIFSKNIRKIPYLASFLGDSFQSSINQDTTAIIGWGHKPTADKARRIAKEKNLPYIALEDGFYRSLDLGCKGANPLSLVVDKTGIYYDATQGSDLENLLNSTRWDNKNREHEGKEKEELLNSARVAIDTIITHNLSKYNHAPLATHNFFDDLMSRHYGKQNVSSDNSTTNNTSDASACLPNSLIPDSLFPDSESVIFNKTKPRILILDQTQGDASISLGLADEQSFINMLDEATKLYPYAFIAIKTHPDVLAGKKKGYLTEEAKKRGIPLIVQDFSPISLLNQIDIVFTVTSQMGFEALLLGKEVHCFGMPFYAGWGLTYDRLTCPRRIKKRNIEELFAASCILYPRYVNPVSGALTDIHETLRLLILQRKHNDANRGFHACVGYSRWKHVHARAYLQGTDSKICFYKNEFKAVMVAKKNQGNVVAWSSKVKDSLKLLCQEYDVPLVRMEDGFIRSVGLGSDFNWPYSLVLDTSGMYYDPNTVSDLENILNDIQNHFQYDALCEEANTLRNFILEKGLTKYNVGNASNSIVCTQFPKNKRIILVPGQVEDDASVRTGGQGIESNLDLLKKVYERNSDAYIIYKPHPDVEKRNRKGAIADEKALEYANIIIRDEKMDVLLKYVHEVHTLTSLTGFEALLRGLVVHVYGMPFYAGWGLTFDLHSCPRRRVKLTLNELIAGTLLLYPSYYDWNTTQFVSAKDICHRLLQPKGQRKGKLWASFINKFREVIRKVRI